MKKKPFEELTKAAITTITGLDGYDNLVVSPSDYNNLVIANNNLQFKLSVAGAVLKRLSSRAPIMGSTGDYREGQIDALDAVSIIAGFAVVDLEGSQ